MRRAITVIATFCLAISGLVYTPRVSYASTVPVGVAQSGGGSAPDTASNTLPSVDCGVGNPVPLHTFTNNTVTSNPKPNFLTASEAEKTTVSGWAPQYTYRGYMGKVYATSSGTCTELAQVYRFANQNTGSHFYTGSTVERDNLIANHSTWMRYDGPAFVAWTGGAAGRVPVYRYFNSGTSVHLFASDVTTAPAGFVKEGVAAFYVQGPTNLTGATAATGWVKTGGYWYYYNASGVKLTGWQKISGDWYYFDPSNGGRMLTGWQNLPEGGSRYEFYFALGDDGRMLTGNRTINGVLERFGAAGGSNEGRHMPCNTVEGMSTRVLSVKPDASFLISPYQAALDTARGRWNNAGVGASISVNSTSTSTITVDPDPSVSLTLYGTYHKYVTGSNVFFRIVVFDASITAAAPQWGMTKENFLALTVTHELGHALRLVDNPAPGGTTSSVMNYTFPPQVVSPTVFDKENVTRCFA